MQITRRGDIGESLRLRYYAEECLLGAILIEATATHSLCIRQVQSLVNWNDFSDARDFDGKHARIFQAMTKCDHPEVVSVAAKLEELGTLKKGDLPYLSHLISSCPTSLDYLYYAKVVRRYARGQEPNDYHGLEV